MTTTRLARWNTLAVLGILLAALSPASAQGDQQSREDVINRPRLNVGLFEVRPDGTIRGSASAQTSEAGEAISGLVYMAPCGSSGTTSSNVVPASATEVWKLSGQLVSIAPEQATAEITWQRLRENGQDVNTPPQTMTAMLNRKDRRNLERVHVSARGTCAERTVHLDAVFGSMADLNPQLATTPANSAVIVGAGGVTNLGGRPPVGAGGGGGVVGGVAAVPSGTGSAVPRGATAGLWLVRSTAGGSDDSSYTTAQVRSFPQSFVFAPMSVRDSTGVLTVTVQGTIEAGQTPDGEHRLFVSASRTLHFAPANGQARDAVPIVEGSTKMSVPVPGPDDVLSFEMPPLRLPGGRRLPDALSIRVRLSRP